MTVQKIQTSFPQHYRNHAGHCIVFLAAALFILAGCSHLGGLYAPSPYTIDNLNIDRENARMETLRGYKDYSGKVVKISPINGGNWADYSRSILWAWEPFDEGSYEITISMSVMAEKPQSSKPLISAYRPSEKISYTASDIKWNGPASIGWTIENGEDLWDQFGGEAVRAPVDRWVDLSFSQTVEFSSAAEVRIFLDGHNDYQGLLDLTLYIRHFKVTVKTSLKYFALTFDNGPSYFTHELLDKLDEHEVRASFFLTGAEIDAVERQDESNDMKEVVKRIFEDEHDIGSLYYSAAANPPSEAAIRRELEDTRIAIQKAVYGENDYRNHPWVCKYFRYDTGQSNTANLVKAAKDLGLPIIRGTGGEEGNVRRTAAETSNRISREAVPWGIYIVKVSESDQTILRVLDLLIPRLKAEGYLFVTIGEMAERRMAPLLPGNLYENLDPDFP